MKWQSFVLLFGLFAAPLSAGEIEELSWLTGHWRKSDDGRITEEMWSTPEGGIMLGTNRTIKASGSAAFEFLRIGPWKEGLAYFASPGGGPATPFEMVECKPNEATFENLEHDFPQRIIYRRTSDQMTARIEGTIDGELRAMEWQWSRLPSAAGPAPSKAKLQGLRTVVYKVPDLKAATSWYTEAVGIAPYFEEPYYVGFNVGGYELGLDPDMDGVTQGDNQPAFWGVKDCKASYARLLEIGGTAIAPPRDVGDGVLVATVKDPFGNTFGIIENPHFRLP